MMWQYQTVLFEFSKNGLLGDRYMDDEEIEKTLNTLGREGWELVSVSLLEDGLLAILKQPMEKKGGSVRLQQLDQTEPEMQRDLSMSTTTPDPDHTERVRQGYQDNVDRQKDIPPEPVPHREQKSDDIFGGIRIS